MPKDIFKRTFYYMVLVGIISVSSVLFLFLLKDTLLVVRAVSLAIVLLSVVAMVWLYYGLVYRKLKLLSTDMAMLADGKVPIIESSKLKASKLFRYTYRVGRRYCELDSNIKGLINGMPKCNKGTRYIDGDVIGGAIMELDSYMLKLQKEEKEWKDKEGLRTWINQGVAKFSELLRSHVGTSEEGAQNVLSELIRYLKFNQGGIFILGDEDSDRRILKMIACYAYDRNKIADIDISDKEGVVSAVCYEKQSIYMNDIPDNYMRITSGMGGAKPRSIYVVPLICDGAVVGVMELASFNEMKQHEKDLVEKVAESYASTISSNKLNEKTSELLKQSQKQAADLFKQEEELRNNMEEMRAQQEDMEQKQTELVESENLMRKIIDMIPFPIFVKDSKRRYIVANQAQAKLFNTRIEGLIGRADSDLIRNEDELTEIFKSDNKVLVDNEEMKLPEQSISLPDGTKRILQTIKVPFENHVEDSVNILGVSFDFTNQRKVEKELEEKEKQIEYFKKKLATMDN